MKMNYSDNQETCKYVFFEVALIFKFLTLAFEALQNLATRELSLLSQQDPALSLHSSQNGPCVTSGYCQYFPNVMSLLKLFL